MDSTEQPERLPEGPPVGPDAEAWEDRYRQGRPHWDLGEPSPPLVELLAREDAPPPGVVLVAGCGAGNDLVALARAGHTPIGVDFAETAIARAREQLDAAGFPDARVIVSDLFDPELPLADGSCDWAFEHTCFCALPPERRADYAALLARVVRPGGELVALHMRTSFTNRAPYDSTPEEFAACFEAAGFELTAHVPLGELSIERRRGREDLLRFRRATRSGSQGRPE